jgi:CubicO group peptidase (beta-lactamase class C family)
MKAIKTIFLFIIPLILFLNCTSPPPTRPESLIQGDYSYLQDYMRWYITKMMQEYKITGVSIALVDDQKVVWTEGFGYANKQQDIYAAPTTIYKAGSISKLFMASAIMQLAEQKKIDIDSPITTYIPEFSMKSRYSESQPITVRSLMTHHAGLPDDKIGGMIIETPSKENCMELINYFQDVHVSYPSNYIFAYSNIGAMLLGEIVERVSGVEFNQYIEENIFLPLNMEHASFIPLYQRDDIIDIASRPYSDKQQEEAEELFFRNRAAGTLNTSVLELSNFIKMILNKGRFNGKQIIDKATLDNMLTPQNKDNPRDVGQIMGLNFYLNRGGFEYAGKYCGHSGGCIYFHSSLNILLDHKIGVAVMTNTDSGNQIIEHIADEALKLAVEIKSGILPPKCRNIPKQIKLTPAEMRKYVGQYICLGAGFVKVEMENDHLVATLSGNKVNVITHEDDWFSFEVKILGFIKIPIQALENLMVAIKHVNGHKIVFINIDGMIMTVGREYNPQPVSEVWQLRLGKYTWINRHPDEYIEFDDPELLIDNDGILCFRDKKSGAYYMLEAISDIECITAGLGRFANETFYIKIEEGQEIIEYSGCKFEKNN